VMDGLDGHVKTDLFTKVGDGNSYLILSEWNDRAAFDGFIASEQFRNVANWGKEEILAARPSHQYYGTDTRPSARPAATPSTGQSAPAPGKCPLGHGG
jgi:heme-degrading monooxygenase HmoA